MNGRVVGTYLPFVPEIHLQPEIVLLGLLPPLLYAAAIQTSLVDFNANRRAILLLSVGLVVVTTLGVGALLTALQAAKQKAEAQMKNTEIRAPMDGILAGVRVIDGELVAEGNELLTVSSQKNYVRGEVNEEDVGEVKAGMKAELQMYAYRTRQFTATVSSILPAADPETQRYTIVLELGNPPENLMAGLTGEMNIITGRHENALLLPTRALLVDQVLIVAHGMVEARTVKSGYRTLDFTEVLNGVKEGAHVVVADQDLLRPGQFVRQRIVKSSQSATGK